LGRKAQKAIPNAQLVELDNIGHLPHIENFERFIIPLIRFLKE
jgi:pimeloyl-ACP methyl ester carboxylesterase